MYIAVSGNIGSGKTTLVEILSKRLGLMPFFEDVNNPYIDDFYKDMHRWAFHLQMAFLGKKSEQLREIERRTTSIIQDRTIYEEAYIFVENLHQMGLIATRDYNTYMNIFKLIVAQIPTPDVIIYLKASNETILSQIYKRGRDYEMNIEPSYINRLNKLYNNWIDNIYQGEVIVIDVDKDDFVIEPTIIDAIVEKLSPYLDKH
ncbi:MAG: deoxynucleoside kinase [Rikenellaceae bacterium]